MKFPKIAIDNVCTNDIINLQKKYLSLNDNQSFGLLWRSHQEMFRSMNGGSKMREFPCIDMVATGKQIRALRRAQGLRVEDVSDYMGFTGPQAVYKWQRGECLPDVVNLLALSRLLKTPMENILRERQEEGDKPSSCFI